jgi:hypothetical protein
MCDIKKVVWQAIVMQTRQDKDLKSAPFHMERAAPAAPMEFFFLLFLHQMAF